MEVDDTSWGFPKVFDCRKYMRFYMRKKIEKEPWIRVFYNIHTRCTSPKHRAYRWYGLKGIKNRITMAEVKKLWLRDKAAEMTRPSIDRLDSSKDYTFKNCRFIEQSENTRRVSLRK